MVECCINGAGENGREWERMGENIIKHNTKI